MQRRSSLLLALGGGSLLYLLGGFLNGGSLDWCGLLGLFLLGGGSSDGLGLNSDMLVGLLLLLDVLGENLIVLGSVFLGLLVGSELVSLVDNLSSESLLGDESLDLG